jgi:hypothetical protein
MSVEERLLEILHEVGIMSDRTSVGGRMSWQRKQLEH